MSNQPARPAKIQPVPMDVAPGLEIEYANIVRITHSPSELILDFAQLLPGSSSAQVTSRIIMSPLGAKLFYRALAENLARFEATFGEIAIPGSSSLADYLFHPPHNPETPPQE